MKRKLPEENLGLPNLHVCWAESREEKNVASGTGLKGIDLPVYLSFSRQLRCFRYAKSVLAAKCKYFRAPLCAPTNFSF